MSKNIMYLFRHLLNFVKNKDIKSLEKFGNLNDIRDDSYSSLLHHAEDKDIIIYLSKSISINNLNFYGIPSSYFILKNIVKNKKEDLDSWIKLLFYLGADFNFKNLYNNESLCDLLDDKYKKYKDIQYSAFLECGYVNYYYKLMMWINLTILYNQHPNKDYFFYFKPNKCISDNLKINNDILKLVNQNWNSFLLNYIDKKENKLCIYCGEDKNLVRCLKCKKVYFCSLRCQRDVYYLHKNFCFDN
jgi:hypothetical protein